MSFPPVARRNAGALLDRCRGDRSLARLPTPAAEQDLGVLLSKTVSHMTVTLSRPQPAAVDQRDPGPPQRHRLSSRLAVALPAIVLAAWATWGSSSLFPHLSHNHDEGVHLLQTVALLDGDLTVPAPANARSFQPWLTALHDGHYVFKYAPVHASLIAAGKLLGSSRIALAAIAAAAAGVVHLLARELGASRRAASAATWGCSKSRRAGACAPALNCIFHGGGGRI
jgi:hypothetical protein